MYYWSSCSVSAAIFVAVTFASNTVAHDPIRVTYRTSDGVEIIGDYWTPLSGSQKAPAVILLHMYRSDRAAWRPQVAALERAGFAVLAIDLRGHGESTDPSTMTLTKRVLARDAKLFNQMHLDVAGAYHWLAARSEVDLSRIGIVGASVGCSVALDYARRDKSIDCVVLMSPGTNYLGVDSLAHLEKYGDRPMMMLTSNEERAAGFDELLEAAKSFGVRVEDSVFNESGIHGTRMYGTVDAIDVRIASFLKEHVNHHTGEHVYAALTSTSFFTTGDSRIKTIGKTDLRVFSSVKEAVERGLHPAD